MKRFSSYIVTWVPESHSLTSYVNPLPGCWLDGSVSHLSSCDAKVWITGEEMMTRENNRGRPIPVSLTHPKSDLRRMFTLEQAMKAQTGSRGITELFNFGARWGWVINATPLPHYPWERYPIPILQETGWAPGLVWTGAENLAFTGSRYPDRPARNESLYRLSYPGLLGRC
jgi:hypothetical protein